MDVEPLLDASQLAYERRLRTLTNPDKTVPGRFCFIALFLYVASFALPVCGDGGPGSSGAAIFLGCFEQNEYPVFLAATPNGPMLFGLFFIWARGWAAARFMATIALLGALSVMLLVWGELEPGQPLDLEIGYYAWASSMALAALAAWAKLR